MVTLTQSAKDYLKSVVSNNDYVTLGVKGGGCSGLQYVWDLKSKLPDVTCHSTHGQIQLKMF